MATSRSRHCLSRCHIFVILITAVGLSLLPTAYGIKCVQCTTLLDRACGYGNIEPTECDADSHYCITYIGKMKGGMLIFRDCIRNRLESVCSTKNIEGQNVRICYETCAEDGCNEGHVSKPRLSFVLLTSLLLCYVLTYGDAMSEKFDVFGPALGRTYAS